MINRLCSSTSASDLYQPVLNQFTRYANLLQMDPSGNKEIGRTVLLTLDVVMKKENAVEQMVTALDEIDGISELKVIASKTDVDY